MAWDKEYRYKALKGNMEGVLIQMEKILVREMADSPEEFIEGVNFRLIQSPPTNANFVASWCNSMRTMLSQMGMINTGRDCGELEATGFIPSGKTSGRKGRRKKLELVTTV